MVDVFEYLLFNELINEWFGIFYSLFCILLSLLIALKVLGLFQLVLSGRNNQMDSFGIYSSVDQSIDQTESVQSSSIDTDLVRLFLPGQ